MLSDKETYFSARSESQLLLHCARTQVSAEDAEKIREITRLPLDWAWLLNEARVHRLLPLLAKHLGEISPDGVPGGVLEELKRLFHLNARRNLFLTKELLGILSLLAAEGIDAIPYKGPVLSASVYGNLALREFSDLDILVRRRDVLRARDILLALQYETHFHLPPRHEEAFLRYQSEYCLSRPDGPLVEVQWRIAPDYFSFALTPEDLMGRLSRGQLGGRSVSMLCPEDLLIVLCAHGAKHMWSRLAWVCDVAELLRAKPDLDWESVMSRGHDLGGRRMISLGLVLARDLLGAPIPEAANQRFKEDAVVKSLAGQVWRRFTSGVSNSEPGLAELCRFNLKARERWRDRLRYGLRLALTPTEGDWALLPLPAPLFFLYYVVRPARLALQYWGGMAKPVSG